MVILFINYFENFVKFYKDDNLFVLNLVKLYIKNFFEIESCEKKLFCVCICGD